MLRVPDSSLSLEITLDQSSLIYTVSVPKKSRFRAVKKIADSEKAVKPFCNKHVVDIAFNLMPGFGDSGMVQ